MHVECIVELRIYIGLYRKNKFSNSSQTYKANLHIKALLNQK
jgi:hypothetical protein